MKLTVENKVDNIQYINKVMYIISKLKLEKGEFSQEAKQIPTLEKSNTMNIGRSMISTRYLFLLEYR